MNNDGSPDIVLALRSSASRLYLNNQSEQPFEGVAAMEIGSTIEPSQPGGAFFQGMSAIEVGDVNSDGFEDVVESHVSLDGTVIRLYFNNGTDAPFDGVEPVAIATDAQDTRDLALVNMDDDDLLDLIVINYTSASAVYRNDGSETPYLEVGSGDSRLGAAGSASIGDVNQDGLLDLFLCNYGPQSSIFLNPFDSSYVAIEGSCASSDLRDLNGDDLPDLLKIAAQGNCVNCVSYALNTGADTEFQQEDWVHLSQLRREGSAKVQFFDVNKDGLLDILIGGRSIVEHANSRLRAVLNQGPELLFDNSPLIHFGNDEVGAGAATVVTADMNGDGMLDIVLGGPIVHMYVQQ